jgi:parallel beta-helix repeat protein
MNANVRIRSSNHLTKWAAATMIAGVALLPQTETLAQSPTSVGCGSVITAPGNYALVADETCSGDGITIAASNVRLDFGRFMLTGQSLPDTAGIRAENVSGLRVSGGALVAFDFGVLMNTVSDVRLENLRVTNSPGDGMELTNIDASAITGCVASDNVGSGIEIRADFSQEPFLGSDDNVVQANTTSNNIDGIRFVGSVNKRNRIIGNIVAGNSDDGIDLGGTNQVVQGNTVMGNQIGIFAPQAANVTIRGNTVTRNGNLGILLGGSSTIPAVGGLIQGNLSLANGTLDMSDGNLPACLNRWKGNTFETDNEGDGPGAGCIQ